MLPEGWRIYRAEVGHAHGAGHFAYCVEHVGALHSSHHTAGQAFRAVEHATGALLRPQGEPLPDGWAVRADTRRGAPVFVVEHVGEEVDVYTTRRAAMRRARLGDGPQAPRLWSAAADHPSLGACEIEFDAHTERGALRRARQILREDGYGGPGWTWRVYAWRPAGDGLRERVLIASRRAGSVRAWRRPLIGGAP